MIGALLDDIRAIRERDPAARGLVEILLCYPGLHAILLHRLGHRLWRLRVPVLPRLVSHLGRLVTGIEIHPGASLGRGVFIDHGMGVVIGETAEVGNNVTMYQGVTLGGTGKQQGKRHPTIGDDVVIGAGAQVLGAITIGEGSKIGGGAVVLRDVPANATAVGVPAKIVMMNGQRVDPLEHAKIPDPVTEVIEQLQQRLRELEQRVAGLEATEVDRVGPQRRVA
jgi:serine O-acetyltransferase